MGLFQLDEKASRESDTPKQFYSLGNAKLRIVTRLLSNGSHYHRPKTRFIIRKIACCSKSKPDPHHFAIFATTVDDSNRVKDVASFCYCAYVLRISGLVRYTQISQLQGLCLLIERYLCAVMQHS